MKNTQNSDHVAMLEEINNKLTRIVHLNQYLHQLIEFEENEKRKQVLMNRVDRLMGIFTTWHGKKSKVDRLQKRLINH